MVDLIESVVGDGEIAITPKPGPGRSATTVPAAFDLGWTMADLAAAVATDVTVDDLKRILPSERELDRLARSRLQSARLTCVSTALRDVLPPSGPTPADKVDALRAALEGDTVDWESVGSQLERLHLTFLDTLACAGRPLVLAYQLGRSLHDTTSLPERQRVDELAWSTFDPRQTKLPKTVEALASRLGRDRVMAIQGWLDALAPHFPADTCAAVKASIGRWSDWASIAFDDEQPGAVKEQTKDVLANEGSPALLRQGDIWLHLLAGAQSLDALLTPEARVAAGEAALARSARIVRRVAVHYWLPIVLLVLAAAGFTAWSGVYLSGAGKVWTQIAVVSIAFGIIAKGIGKRVTTLAHGGEMPIYAAERVDVLAWSITKIPHTKPSNPGVRALRRSGTQRLTPLGKP